MLNVKFDYGLFSGVTYGKNGATVSPSDVATVIPDHYHNTPVVKFPSYEFRVVEWEDSTGKIVKVGLQCRQFDHSPSNGIAENNDPIWVDVPRIKLKYYG